jgi:hypothetical protein
MGCHAQVFFGGAELLNSFLEIKNSNALPRAARVDRESVQWLAAGVRRTSASNRVWGTNIFPMQSKAPGGISKFCQIAWTTAWQRRADFCEIPETFFGGRGSEKTPRNSGGGGR